MGKLNQMLRTSTQLPGVGKWGIGEEWGDTQASPAPAGGIRRRLLWEGSRQSRCGGAEERWMAGLSRKQELGQSAGVCPGAQEVGFPLRRRGGLPRKGLL